MADDDLSTAFFIAPEERDPVRAVQKDLARALPKRFYKQVSVDARNSGFAVLLDGRPIRTPAQNALLLPTKAAAELLAEEWRAQIDTINPHAMPATRLVNSALDGVAKDIGAVAADIVKYAGSDLVCYRAAQPQSLVDAQTKEWDIVLSHMRETHGARFVLGQGVMYIEQPREAIAAFDAALNVFRSGDNAALQIAALHSLTALSGSALIALALAEGAMALEQAWTAAHVDEDHQLRLWGADSEAQMRREKRFLEFQAADRLLQALDAPIGGA